MQPEDSVVGCLLSSLYTEAFRRLGYTLAYRHVPAARGNYLARFGMIDGELGRVEDYGKKFPTLVRVDEPHLTEEFRAYATRSDISVSSWHDFNCTTYHIGYRRGTVKIHRELKKRVAHEQITTLPNTTSGLRMLEAGRIDIFIGPRQTVEECIHSGEFSHANIKDIGIVDTHNAHAYLHKRHARLAEKLTAVLRTMKKESLHTAYSRKCGIIDRPFTHYGR